MDLNLIKTQEDVVEALKWKTQFEKDVLVATFRIPKGKISTYKRIAEKIKDSFDGRIYLVDPNSPKSLEDKKCIVVQKNFDRNLDFLAEEDKGKPKAFISLRTPVSTAYEAIIAGIDQGAVFFALEPLFYSPQCADFPLSREVSSNYSQFRSNFNDLQQGRFNFKGCLVSG